MSKRSEACSISIKTKQIVWDRDNQKCIICGKYVPMSNVNAHYIKRSQGGLGIPENIVTLCQNCHYEEDFGKNTQQYEDYIKNYLKQYYGGSWNEKDLYYNKWR